MTRSFLSIQGVRFAGICHLVGLLLVVVHYIPPGVASSETKDIQAPDTSLLHINDDGLTQANGGERTRRLTREAVLPLGHRYIGLGKRLGADDDDDDGATIARDTKKRRYSLNEGNAMRFTGLGKRGGHSGLRFIGLGKRNPAAMRFIGLGKRIIPGGYGDGGGLLDLDSDETEDVNGSEDYYSIQDRSSKK